ncbi:MAG: hypothetical protein ACLUD2_00755 [Clostridium sp.]
MEELVTKKRCKSAIPQKSKLADAEAAIAALPPKITFRKHPL